MQRSSKIDQRYAQTKAPARFPAHRACASRHHALRNCTCDAYLHHQHVASRESTLPRASSSSARALSTCVSAAQLHLCYRSTQLPRASTCAARLHVLNPTTRATPEYPCYTHIQLHMLQLAARTLQPHVHHSTTRASAEQ